MQLPSQKRLGGDFKVLRPSFAPSSLSRLPTDLFREKTESELVQAGDQDEVAGREEEAD